MAKFIVCELLDRAAARVALDVSLMAGSAHALTIGRVERIGLRIVIGASGSPPELTDARNMPAIAVARWRSIYPASERAARRPAHVVPPVSDGDIHVPGVPVTATNPAAARPI